MAIGVKSGGLFSGIFLGYICACLQFPSKGLRVVVLMAYLKIIWGFWAALLLSERKDLFVQTVLNPHLKISSDRSIRSFPQGL